MNSHFVKLSSESFHSFTNQKIESLSQQAWYLQSVSETVYLYESNNCIFILPVKNILGLNKIILPPFIQRLDPIQIKDGSSDFPDEIINTFPCGIISFSSRLTNPSPYLHETIRNNFVLPLNSTYEDLFANYNKGHKLNLKETHKLGISTSSDIQSFTTFYFKNGHSGISLKLQTKVRIRNLINECITHDKGTIYFAKNNKNEVLAAAFITRYNNRLTYLISCSSPEGKRNYAMHAIIDYIIKLYSSTDYILDFEGSMIPGVAYFMKGFGAQLEHYYVYHWDRHWLCKVKNMVKRIF
jgi:hypothetical protein